ncbi:PREDICTED: kinetochore protein spc24-like, partial [Branchiostoma belcheri]|uniref:Kinetochore protein Spc24 n=1 Tax=Branchiostoma belcheri TaxID=7741 RepID=A0A6P4Y8J5_BRABE
TGFSPYRNDQKLGQCLQASEITSGSMKKESIMQEKMDIVSEMITMLAAGEQAEELERVTEVWAKINQLREEQQEDVKKTIQALLAVSEEEEQKVKSISQSEEGYQRKEAELEAEKSQAEKQRQQAEQGVQSLMGKVEKLKEEQAAVSRQKETVKQNTTEALPDVRYLATLYSNVTKLKWDFTGGPDDIKGFVTCKSDVKPFSLNSKQNSKFFVANYLWDLMDESFD